MSSTSRAFGLLAVAWLLACTACSSASTRVSPPLPSPSGAANVRTASLEHALLAKKGQPRPTKAACTPATIPPSDSPFGTGRQPVYRCRLTILGASRAYVVEVEANGCYVAERARKGQAVYGCGAEQAASPG